MAGSSSTMAMRRDIAGEYSPSGVHPSACHRFARIARRVATRAPGAAPVVGPQCLPEHRTGGTHETLAAVSGIGRRARRRGRHGARRNRLGARYARVCGAVPMNREHEIALGVECAWTPLPEPRRSSWLWIVFITLLVALGAWQLGRGAWIQAKAWLAQSLIAHAWARTLSGERQAKPWPWADTWPVARLTVPRLGIKRYALAGADGAAMAFGPGHVSGTPLPGEAGNSVIGGHPGTPPPFPPQLKPGDMLISERADGRRVAHRVGGTEVLGRGGGWGTKQGRP